MIVQACINGARPEGYHPAQRWSRDFGPVVKVDQLVKEMIPNDEEKEPLS